LSGGKRITYDNSVYLSEKNSAHTNFALAHLMMSKGVFPKGADIKKVLDFYLIKKTGDSATLSFFKSLLLIRLRLLRFFGIKTQKIKNYRYLFSF
jgi:glutaminase